MNNRFPKPEIIVILLLAIISAALRFHTNFSTEFIPGAVGAFYIVQVRSVIEHGVLAFREFPLIFYLEAILAKAVMFIWSVDIPTAVDVASRLFDSIVPPLSILPAYFLVRESFGDIKNRFAAILISSVSVFYISFFMLVSDYQKNALGLLWLFCLMLFVFKSLEKPLYKNYLQALLFFILTGLTHFGCFTVALLFLFITLVSRFLQRINVNRFIKLVFTSIIVMIVGWGVIYFISPDRAMIVLRTPLEIFESPMIIAVLNKKPVLSPADLLNVLFINIAVIMAFFLFIKEGKILEPHKRIFFLSSIITCFILSSPVLGTEWALRLYYISYIFLIPIIAYLFTIIKVEFLNKLLIGTLVVILLSSFILTKREAPVSNMNKACYEELTKMKKVIPQEGTTLIVARMGLGYWAAWIFRTYISNEEDVRKEWWNGLDRIYYLVQVKDKAPFGPAGLYGPAFPEPRLPGKTELVFEGQYFKLYFAPNPPAF